MIGFAHDHRRLRGRPAQLQPRSGDRLEEIGQQPGIEGNRLRFTLQGRWQLTLGLAGLLTPGPQAQASRSGFEDDRAGVPTAAEEAGDAHGLAQAGRLNGDPGLQSRGITRSTSGKRPSTSRVKSVVSLAAR